MDFRLADNILPFLGIMVLLHSILVILYIRSQKYIFALGVSVVIILLLWTMYRIVENEQSPY